jgi:hypothetical protein
VSDINPYASFLGSRAPLEAIAGTTAELHRIFEALGAEADKPLAPGKWSPREILCHLADCEIVFGFRLRQALAQDHHTIQPFDQDKWASAYGSYDVKDALAVFSSVRHWNVAFIEGAGAWAFAKTLNHPERGEMTFQTVVETMAGHDINHLQQLGSIAR